MKLKNPISFLILFLLISVTCFSQSIVNRANSSYTVQDARLAAQYNLLTPRYADSTAANLQKGIDSCGAVVYLYSTHTFWYRSCASSTKKWVEIGSGGGGGGTWGSITGTLSNQTDLQNALNLKANLASPTFTGTVTIPTPFTLGAVSVLPTGTELNFVDGVTSSIQTQLDNKQPLDADLTTIAGLTATTDNFIVSVSSAWASRTPAQVNAILPVFTDVLNGLVPLSGGGSSNFLRADGTWAAPSGSGANTALSNLASVAINTSLISDANNTDDLGSTSLAWKDIYSYSNRLKGATSGEITLVATAIAGTNTITFPASTGTVGLLGTVQTWTANNTWTGATSQFSGTILNTSGGVQARAGLFMDGSAPNGNLSIPSPLGISNTVGDADYDLEGATTTTYRVAFSGTTSTTLTTGSSFASMILAQMPLTEGTGGNHPLLSVLALRPSNITGGVSTVSNTATLYIAAPMSATVSGANYALWVKSGNVEFTNGNLTLGTAGNKLNIATGSNASVGTSTLVGGTVTVSTTAVTASSKIFLTVGVAGGTQGDLSVGTVTAGTSFVINSTSGTETSQVNWFIIN